MWTYKCEKWFLPISDTPTTPPYKPIHLPAYASRTKPIKSLPMYVYPSSQHNFCQKRDNAHTPNNANNTTCTNHKPSHGYAFYSNHICPPSNRLTQELPRVCIWFNHIRMNSNWPTHTLHHILTHLKTQTQTHTDSHAHTYTHELTYAQPSPYINISANSNTHAHGLTFTHIYVQTQEDSVHNLFLSFQHM